MNFYVQYKKKPKTAGSGKKLWLKAIPAAVTLIVCIVASTVLIVRNIGLQSQLDEVNDYITDPSVVEAYTQSQDLAGQISVLSSYVAQDEYALQAIESYPLPNSSVTDAIKECGEGQVTIDIQSYQAPTGSFNFPAEAVDVTTINHFIDKLEESELFARVEYSGYVFVNETQNYLINVSCYLNEMAGK